MHIKNIWQWNHILFEHQKANVVLSFMLGPWGNDVTIPLYIESINMLDDLDDIEIQLYSMEYFHVNLPFVMNVI